MLSIIMRQAASLPPETVKEKLISCLENGVISTGEFAIAGESIPGGLTLDDWKKAVHAVNCKTLEDYLASHPLLWTDGELYRVTEADQQRMLMYFSTYSMGLREKLEWNSHTKKCREFTTEEFMQLCAAINNFVAPRVKKCQEYKERIFAAQTIQEVEAITFDFDDV